MATSITMMSGNDTVTSDGASTFDEEIKSVLHILDSRGGGSSSSRRDSSWNRVGSSASSASAITSDRVVTLASDLLKSFHALEETARMNAKYQNPTTTIALSTNSINNNNNNSSSDMLWDTLSASFRENCSISLRSFRNDQSAMSRSGVSAMTMTMAEYGPPSKSGAMQGYTPSSGSLYQRPSRLADVHGKWERIRTHFGNSHSDGMSFTEGSSGYGWDIESIVKEEITGILPESFVSDELMKSVNQVDTLLTQNPNVDWDTLQRKLNDLRCDLQCVNNGNEDLKEATQLTNSMRDAVSRPSDFEVKWIKIKTAIGNNALKYMETASSVGNTTTTKSKVAGMSVSSVDSTLFAEELIRSLQNIDAALTQTHNLDWDVLWQALHTLKGDLLCFDNRQGLKQAAQLISNMRGDQRCCNFESQWEQVRALIADEVRTACSPIPEDDPVWDL